MPWPPRPATPAWWGRTRDCRLRVGGARLGGDRPLLGAKAALGRRRPGPPARARPAAPAVAVAEEAGGAPLQVVDAHPLPLGGVSQPHRLLGVLVADQVLARVAAVHAHQPV